jgi:hypothetical protein
MYTRRRVITLGQTQSDNFNQMITITNGFYLLIVSKQDNVKVHNHIKALYTPDIFAHNIAIKR